MADQLIIQKDKVVVTTDEGRRIERNEAQLMAMLRRELLPPLGEAALPDGVKFLEWREPFLLVVHQLPPQVRLVRWIADDSRKQYGPGTKYRKLRLSMPYAITFALYVRHQDCLFLVGWNELYFRNEPLRSKTDRLGYAALLNISCVSRPNRLASWICTQYLRGAGRVDWTEQLCALLEHTWNGGFNLSSEHHEGESWYNASKGVHTDLHPVQRWEQATAANEAFALGVPWKPVPLSVGELMEHLLEEHCQGTAGWPTVPFPEKRPPSLVNRFLNFAQGSHNKS
jgi:hypothetical protein